MDKVDSLHQVNDGLKNLIDHYPGDHPVAVELRKVRDHIIGLMLGDKAGTLAADSQNSETFGGIMAVMSKTRIKRALDRMGQEEKVAERLLEREQLKRLLAD